MHFSDTTTGHCLTHVSGSLLWSRRPKHEGWRTVTAAFSETRGRRELELWRGGEGQAGGWRSECWWCCARSLGVEIEGESGGCSRLRWAEGECGYWRRVRIVVAHLGLCGGHLALVFVFLRSPPTQLALTLGITLPGRFPHGLLRRLRRFTRLSTNQWS